MVPKFLCVLARQAALLTSHAQFLTGGLKAAALQVEPQPSLWRNLGGALL